MPDLHIEAVQQADFRIEVDGTVEPGDAIKDHDRIDEFHDPNAAWIEYSESQSHELGASAPWHYTGEITSFDVRSGEINVQVNGEDVTPGQLEAHYAHYPMDRVVVMADEGADASYKVEVDGSVEQGAGFGGAVVTGTVTDETGTGGWSDFYYDGEIREFNVDGSATVYHNCGPTDPKDLVSPPYEPPQAAFTTSKDYLKVTFDASPSESGTAAIDGYEWNIDGTLYSGQVVTHTFTSDGTYNVELTVTDAEGGEDTASDTVTVSAQEEPPTADFTHSTDGLTVTLDASPSSAGSNPIDRYEWTIQNRVYAGQTLSHTFDGEGTYTVQLSVYDSEGLDDTTSTSVTVEDDGGGPGIRDVAPLLAAGVVGAAMLSDDSDVLGSVFDAIEDGDLNAAKQQVKDAQDDDESDE